MANRHKTDFLNRNLVEDVLTHPDSFINPKYASYFVSFEDPFLDMSKLLGLRIKVLSI